MHLELGSERGRDAQRTNGRIAEWQEWGLADYYAGRAIARLWTGSPFVFVSCLGVQSFLRREERKYRRIKSAKNKKNLHLVRLHVVRDEG